MEDPNVAVSGGLILQTKELKKILEEKACIGLAFGVKEPGRADNVDLKVYKVTHDGTQFVGEPCTINRKKGAASMDADSGGLDDYRFEYYKGLVGCKFDFAFLSREDFETIIRNGEKEIFIGGGMKSFGEGGLIQGNWFTLTMSPRTAVTRESPRGMRLPHQMKFLESCPPRWTVDESGHSTTDKGKEFKFKAKG